MHYVVFEIGRGRGGGVISNGRRFSDVGVMGGSRRFLNK